jgi:AcrR family transcriptional regulator
MGQEATTRVERTRKASRHRREQEKEELRQIILTAASDLFLEQGYDRFSMRQLAERIGYSATTLYLYFRDKDDLLFTIVDDGFVNFGRLLANAANTGTDPWVRLTALGQAYLNFGFNNPAYYQLMFMWRTDYLTEARAGEKQPRLAAFSILQDTVQYALDMRVLQPGSAQAYSDLLWAMLHGVVALAIGMPTMFDPERTQTLTTVALDTLFKALYKQP